MLSMLSMARVVSAFFPVFLLFVHSHSTAAASQVDSPTNVTLYCRNLHNRLTWSYDEQPTGLRFRVFIGRLSGDPIIRWVDPPHLEVDLSFLSKSNQDYYVSVTAVVNGTKSAPSKGIEFSYFMDSPASQKCNVDLPPVNVTAPKPDIIRFSFVHPLLFHKPNLSVSVTPGTKKKKRSQDLQLPEFEYSVVLSNQTEQPHSFSCVQSVCEETLPVNVDQEPHCVEISGEMEGMSVTATQGYCTRYVDTSAATDYYIYIIVASVLLGIISVIVCMVVMKRTKPSSSLPGAIQFLDQRRPLTLGGDREQVSVLNVEPRSPTPLLTDKQEDIMVSIPETNGRYPIGVSAEDEGVCEDEEEQNTGDSEYMLGRNLEEGETLDTEETHSGYETRNPVLVHLASDELAEGYRG